MKNKLTTVFTFLFVLFAVCSAFFGTPSDGGESIYDSMTVTTEAAAQIAEEAIDDSMEAVAAYIHENGCLPDFYMTKNDAEDTYGWDGGPLDKLAPGMAIGGDRFGNYDKLLPTASGRTYTECDIDTIGAEGRGAKRSVFSNDGLIYFTDDHYESFELLYGEP